MSLVWRLKCPLSCFAFYFCFLVIFVLLILLLSVLFLVVLINLPLRFCKQSLSRCIDALTLSSMLARPPLPPFLNTYCLSAGSLECKAIWMIIIFLAHWSICLSSSRVHFKNGAEYITRRTAQVFISFIRFLLYSLLFRSLEILLLVFSLISACFMVSASNISKYL